MNAVTEAVRLLRREADYYANDGFIAAGESIPEAEECRRVADALEIMAENIRTALGSGSIVPTREQAFFKLNVIRGLLA